MKEFKLLPIKRESYEVRKILQEWLEKDNLEEIIIIGKQVDQQYVWDHSLLKDPFWWVGLMTYIINLLTETQE